MDASKDDTRANGRVSVECLVRALSLTLSGPLHEACTFMHNNLEVSQPKIIPFAYPSTSWCPRFATKRWQRGSFSS